MPLKKIAIAVQQGLDALAQLDFVYKYSIHRLEKQVFALAHVQGGRQLVILRPGRDAGKFEGTMENNGEVKLCPLNSANLQVMEELFPWLKPQVAGKRTSFGFGDRLGLATPGHVRAQKPYQVFPIFAQQSMREMKRTGRTMQNVLEDAAWGVYQEGHGTGYGADADHIKTVDEALACQEAGFTMFTVDASEHLDNKADFLSREEVMAFWQEYPQKPEMASRYLHTGIVLPDQTSLEFDEEKLARCLIKYGRAIDHIAAVFAALVQTGGTFDFEVSLDETANVTLPEHHYLVSRELANRGVRLDSLAPRFTGEMQKAVDFSGDRQEFERQLKQHAEVARILGDYKVSVHSGSDKFAIYPAVRRSTNGYFHVKTAGTSWVAAMEVVARRHPALYRECHKFALERFGEDRASYYVTTDLSRIPPVDALGDEDLAGLLYQPDPRQLIHLTYGSLLTARNTSGQCLFRDQIYQVLNQYEADYNDLLVRHLGKHLELLGMPRK